MQEGDEEEKKEVSGTLKKLRFKYDEVHKLVAQKEAELEKIRKTLEQVQTQEVLEEGDQLKSSENLDNLEQEYADTKYQHEVEQMQQKTYYHMLGRMKKDLISQQIRTNELGDSLKSKNLIVDEELEKSRKSKEQRLQSKYKLDNIMKNIEQEQKKRQERIQSLQKSIRNKEDAVQRRMDRVRRQQEIAETAAAENKDSGELKMRENFMIQKLWSVFLKRKMEHEMRKTSSVEDAFQKIRAATGLTDVQDIVHKFLTREQTYSQLLVAVAENERKIDLLKKENEECNEQLHNILIDKEGVEKRKTAPEIELLDVEISGLKKELDASKDRS